MSFLALFLAPIIAFADPEIETPERVRQAEPTAAQPTVQEIEDEESYPQDASGLQVLERWDNPGAVRTRPCGVAYDIPYRSFCFHIDDNNLMQAPVLDRSVVGAYRYQNSSASLRAISAELNLTEEQILAAVPLLSNKPLEYQEFRELNQLVGFTAQDLLRLPLTHLAALGFSEAVAGGGALVPEQEFQSMMEQFTRLLDPRAPGFYTVSDRVFAYLLLPHREFPQALDESQLREFFAHTNRTWTRVQRLANRRHLLRPEIAQRLKPIVGDGLKKAINETISTFVLSYLPQTLRNLRAVFGIEYTLQWCREIINLSLNEHRAYFVDRTRMLRIITDFVKPALDDLPEQRRAFYRLIMEENRQYLSVDYRTALALAPLFELDGLMSAADRAEMRRISEIELKEWMDHFTKFGGDEAMSADVISHAERLSPDALAENVFNAVSKNVNDEYDANYDRWLTNLYDLGLKKSLDRQDFIMRSLMSYVISDGFRMRTRPLFEERLFANVFSELKMTPVMRDNFVKHVKLSAISAKAECLRRMFSLMPLFEGDFANRQKYKTALSEIIVNHARSILERNRARPTDEMVAENLRVLHEYGSTAVMTAFIRSVTENGELRADEDQILPSLSRAYIASIMAPYLARTRSAACGEVVNIR